MLFGSNPMLPFMLGESRNSELMQAHVSHLAFISDCEQYDIKVTFAAPRHQEMNGICERAWATVRNIAFSFLVHARIVFEFFPLALEHAWKVHACLPIKDVQVNDQPITPFEYFFQAKPTLSRFKVLFCPCSVNIGPTKDKKTKQILNRKNNPERAIRGIHVGIPRHAPGWLVYLPSTNTILVSNDVAFDEVFLSTVTHTKPRFTGGQLLQPKSLAPPTFPEELEHTDAPKVLKPSLTSDPEDVTTPHQPFSHTPDVAEYFDLAHGELEEEPSQQQESQLQESLHYDSDDSQASSPSSQRPKRSQPKVNYSGMHSRVLPDDPGEWTLEDDLYDLMSYIQAAHNTEVLEEITGKCADDFLPAPGHYREFNYIPPAIAKHWIQALKKELELLILKMCTFSQQEPNHNDIVIPVTAKCRTKLQSDGTIDKLKLRVCLRGDQQGELVDWDTWCPIAGFRELKLFLQLAARLMCRIWQLDFIGAFLQAQARNRVFTTLPKDWAKWFPHLSEWFGKPLLLLKSLYGSVDASKNWDDDLSDWLINVYGFHRVPGAGSIYTLQKDNDFIYLLNAVDDQLYFSNSDTLRKDFEKSLSNKFDVELMGQAHWYLQARVTQHSDYSITLDQARYSALISTRFLPNSPTTNITPEDLEKYKTPLPKDFVPTKQDLSQDYMTAKELETEYGFQYSSAIGMLIFLMNSASTLQFAIRKLAKFNNRPGRKHYQAAIHLLHHVRTQRLTMGLRFYSPKTTSPVQTLLTKTHADFKFEDHPIIVFTDSSWQDCPDTGKSTGCYLIYINGSLVDAASFVPTPVALSSAEAEYNACAFALTAVIHNTQIYNTLQGTDPDKQVTVPMFVDSASAVAMMANERINKRTRHIARRIHFVRQAKATGIVQPYKVDGVLNPSDIGTKNLDAPTFLKHKDLIHVQVAP